MNKETAMAGLVFSFIAMVIFTGCAQTKIETTNTPIPKTNTQVPSVTFSDSPTPNPTSTITPSPTITNTPIPIVAGIYPNLEQARKEGFDLLAGHAPFEVDFNVEASGGNGELTYAWDFDGNGSVDSTISNPAPFIYNASGIYTSTLIISDQLRQDVMRKQRIVVIGEPDWPDWRYGVCAHLERVPEFYGSFEEVNKALEMMEDINIDVVRTDFVWARIQPDKETLDWHLYDNLVDLSQKHGIDFLPIINYGSEWASSVSNPSTREEWLFAAPSINDFGWFSYLVADRYKSTIHAWEIWNEPNVSQFWRPEPNPIIYSKLLHNAYLAIKYADPNDIVVLAGLANDESANIPQFVWYSPENYLNEIYNSEEITYFDVVGRHPYTHPNYGVGYLKKRLIELRLVMDEHYDTDKPIWVTEIGYSASIPSEVTDERQGWWLSKSFDAIFSLNYIPVVF